MTCIPTTTIFVTIDGQLSHADTITVPDTEAGTTITHLRATLKQMNPHHAVWVGFRQDIPRKYWQNVQGDYVRRSELQRCTIDNIQGTALSY